MHQNQEQARDAKRFGFNRTISTIRKIPSLSEIQAFRDFNHKNGNLWKIRYHPRTGLPEAMLGGRSVSRVGSPENAARSFLAENMSFLKVRPSDLRLNLSHAVAGIHHLLFEQSYRGIPVEFSRIKVHLTDSGEVIALQSKFEPEIRVSLTPAFSESQALGVVSQDLGSSVSSSGKLVLFPWENDGQVHLAWKFKVDAVRPLGKWYYYVDAHTGQLLLRYNDLRFQACLTSGTVSGLVYPTDPFTTSAATVPFQDQNVWVQDSSTFTVTDGNGSFCSATAGRIFTSLKGPYIHVAHQKKPGAHYDNALGQWFLRSESVSSPNPYSNDYFQASTVSLGGVVISPPGRLVKVMPVFSTLNVGGIDVNGNVSDDDELFVTDGLGRKVASYIGDLGAINAAAVEGSTYAVHLKTNSSGQQSGFSVVFSSYLVLCPSGVCDPAVPDNATSTFTWNASRTADGTLDEVNAFYHINQFRGYLAGGVNASSAAPINFPINVMVHAGPTGMDNAFYNPEFKNLFFGDSPTPSTSFALDGTVVRHEYTHFMVDHIYPLINFGQSGAISEALADYFSGSSLNTSQIGRGVNAGSSLRNLADGGCPSSTCKVFPTDWVGEIHDDSLILSQALWRIRNRLGTSQADSLVFRALFYFPDSFQEFQEAATLLCLDDIFGGGGGSSCTMVSHIAGIFSDFVAHGIPVSGGDVFESNDGPEAATDISTRPVVSATIYPGADLDYYTFASVPGTIKAKLDLPARPGVDGNYYAYGMILFDQDRQELTRAYPPYNINPTADGRCPDPDPGGPNPDGQCYTTSPSVSLEYPVSQSGRFYLVVTAGLTDGESNGHSNTTSSYGLRVDFDPAGVVSGGIVTASYDNDLLSFSVRVPTFSYVGTFLGMTAQEYQFSFAQLRDQSRNILSETATDQPGSYLGVVSSNSSAGTISGQVRIQSGFASRFPSVGTVYLEIFGENHHSDISGVFTVHSLGLSNPINLTANQGNLAAWNNVFNPRKGQKATVKYELLQAGNMNLKLYTLSGQLVKVLFDGAAPAGKGSVDWEGINDFGDTVASGIYLLRMEAPGFTKTQKIVVIK
ncbi:MAG: T9SS type A sorting domain-containing protein [Elusimicrobia bacterium]|nr:T9SS type A sorting domain-containing protein [Elusimicrobiota bacterium]